MCKNLYMNIHSSISHNSQEVGITQYSSSKEWINEGCIYMQWNTIWQSKGMKHWFMLQQSMTLEHVMPSERIHPQRPHITRFHLYDISRIGKSTEADNRTVLARGWKEQQWGTGFFGGVVSDENIPELKSCNSFTTLKVANTLIYKLYLNKAV